MKKLTPPAIAACALIIGGCGGDSTPAGKGPGGNPAVAPEQKNEIVEALKKNGINNPPAAIFDDGPVWTVTLTPEGTGPDGAPPPGPPKLPDQVSINKTTKEVKRVGKRDETKRGDAGKSGTHAGETGS